MKVPEKWFHLTGNNKYFNLETFPYIFHSLNPQTYKGWGEGWLPSPSEVLLIFLDD